MKMPSFHAPAKIGGSKKVGLPSAPKIHPAADIKTKVRFPDSGAIGAAPAIQTPVGRI